MHTLIEAGENRSGRARLLRRMTALLLLLGLVASACGGDDGEVESVAALAGQPLGSCDAIDTDALTAVFGEPVQAEAVLGIAQRHRTCAFWPAGGGELLGQLNLATDTNARSVWIPLARYTDMVPFPELHEGAEWQARKFTAVQIHTDGVELLFEARQNAGDETYAPADHEVMGEAVAGLVAAMAPGEVTAELPPTVFDCDDLPIDEIAGETLGPWTSGTFDGMLLCHASSEADAGSDGEHAVTVSVLVGSTETADGAEGWLEEVTRRTDSVLVDETPTPITAEGLDRGVRLLAREGIFDLPGEEALWFDSATAIRDRYGAMISVSGTALGQEGLGPDLLAETLGAILAAG